MHGINVVNDTGSDILTLFYTDLSYLGNYWAYTGWLGRRNIGTAGGHVEQLWAFVVELRFVQPANLVSWRNRFREAAILRHYLPVFVRLSGWRMRHHFFFRDPTGQSAGGG
jgi:hypothetical protein